MATTVGVADPTLMDAGVRTESSPGERGFGVDDEPLQLPAYGVGRPAASSVCQAVWTAAAAACRVRRPGWSAYAAAAVRARAVARRSGPSRRSSAGPTVTSQETAPAATVSARCPGTWPRCCGAKSAAEVTKVKITGPGGPMRVASQSTFCPAARSAPTAISTAVESVSEAVTRDIAIPMSMPTTTPATVRARRAYGRLWPYSAQSEPAIVYITRSSRPKTKSARFGTAEATTTLSAGLNHMSEGRVRRNGPTRGSLRTEEGCRVRMVESLTQTL